MATTAPLVEVEHLCISYGAPPGAVVPAVCDVSFAIAPGETVALVGETGSGKSTLALGLCGLSGRAARSGTVRIEGRDALGSPGLLGRRIGIVFQDSRSALNPVLRVGSHLLETIRAHRDLPATAARLAAVELLRDVGLGIDVLGRYPFELSGGMCQRVGIALAVCHRPKLLIADEPTSSIDPGSRSRILRLLRAMKDAHGLALLVVSHDLSVIADVADRILVMYHGRIVESGSAQEIFRSPAHRYTLGLTGCRLDLESRYETRPLPSIPGSPPGPAEQFAGCAFAPRCGSPGRDCGVSLPPLRRISETHQAACPGER